MPLTCVDRGQDTIVKVKDDGECLGMGHIIHPQLMITLKNTRTIKTLIAIYILLVSCRLL